MKKFPFLLPDPDGVVSQEFYDGLKKYGASEKLLKKLRVRESKKEKK